MKTYDDVADRVKAADPAPSETELPEVMWDSYTLLEMIDRRSASHSDEPFGADSDDVAPQRGSLIAGPRRWRTPLAAVGTAVVVLVVGAATTLLLGSPRAADPTNAAAVVSIESSILRSEWCAEDSGFLCTLSPSEPVHPTAKAWETVSAPRRLRARSADEVWLAGGPTSIEAEQGRSSGLFRLASEGTLHWVAWRWPKFIDAEGRPWRLGGPKGPKVFVGDEWTPFEAPWNAEEAGEPRGNLAAAGSDGAFWFLRRVGSYDTCSKESHGGYRRMELRRWDDQGWTVWPCEALPDIFDGQLAVGPDGVAYLAGPAGLPPEGNAFYRSEGNEFAQLDRLEIADEGKPAALRGLHVAPNGDLWTVQGEHSSVFARHDGTRWDVFGIDGELGVSLNQYQDRFSIGPDGRVWIATGSSLALFDGTDWQHLLEGEPVNAVSVAHDGTIWAAIGGTIQRFPATWGGPQASDPVDELVGGGFPEVGRFGVAMAIAAVAAGIVLILVWALITHRGRTAAHQ